MEPDTQQPAGQPGEQSAPEAVPSEVAASPEPTPSASTARPVISKSSGISGKKIILIILAALLLVSAAGLIWYLFLRGTDDDGQANRSVDSSQGDSARGQLQMLPEVLVYARRENGTAPYKLYTRPATGEGDPVEVMTLSEGLQIREHAIHGRQVAVAVEPSGGADGKTIIYYSSDAGSAYEAVYEQPGSVDSLAISSLIFSTDGSKLAVAMMRSPDGQNVTVEIDTATGSSKDLFESETQGVFLKAYDAKGQQIIYSKGCMDCDNLAINNTVYKRSLASDDPSETVVFNASQNQIVTSVIVRNDFQELLYVVSAGGQDTGSGLFVPVVPSSLKRLNMETGEVSDLVISDTTVIGMPGYLTDGRTPYFITDKEVLTIKDADNWTTRYESSTDVHGVMFINDEALILSTDAGQGNFAIKYFSTGAVAPLILIEDSAETVVLGVALK